ncbi:MAG TPA: DMT family transporter [Bacteroidales bacterium]|nr:DMT family transporter [Bacteroidales bacterium]HRZ50020.1 DMT family transporter [Bacteroidales bacterium]
MQSQGSSHNLRPVFAVLLAMAFWGMTFVWVKIALRAFNPVSILLIRLVLSSLLLWVIIIITGKYQKIHLKDIRLFALSAFFQPFLYFLGETYGLSYVSSALGSIIISTIPVFTPAGTWLVYREKLGWKNLLGFLASFTGVVLIVFAEGNAGETSLVGVIMLFVAVVAAIANALTVKKLTASYNSFMIVTVQNLFGIFYFIPLFFLLDYPDMNSISTDPRIWRNLLALAVFGSTLAFLFFTYAIRSLGVNRSSIYSNLIPVFTALFAFLFLGESFPFLKIIGMAIVIGGVLVVSLRNAGKKSATFA